jgi:hypothetical protein
MNSLRLQIQWDSAIEYIRISPGSSTARNIRTEEDWLDGSALKVYNPRVVSRAIEIDGSERIVLEYLAEDHDEPRGSRVIWGKSNITIASDRSSATVVWVSSPVRSDDGQAPCLVINELTPTEAQREEISRIKRSQAKFKAELLRRESQCAASGEKLSAVLEAAHIQDVEHLGPSIPENGILLRSDLHKLFDDGYFSIAEDGAWLFHSSLPQSYREQFHSARISSDIYERVKDFILKRNYREPSPK